MADQPDINRQEEFDLSVAYGASFDKINLSAIIFWLILGTLIVTIIMYGLYNMYSYNQFLSSERAEINAEFYDVNKRRDIVHQKLNSIEIIDAEQGLYRIPIDSAMSLIANDSN